MVMFTWFNRPNETYKVDLNAQEASNGKIYSIEHMLLPNILKRSHMSSLQKIAKNKKSHKANTIECGAFTSGKLETIGPLSFKTLPIDENIYPVDMHLSVKYRFHCPEYGLPAISMEIKQLN